MGDAVDWDLAVRRSAGVTRAGPPIDLEGLRSLVASLRQSALDAPAYVAEVTGLTEEADQAGERPVLVVDRPRWAASAVESFRSMVGDELPPARLPGSARIAGEQLGWALSLMSTRILGQYDPYAVPPDPSEAAGRLLLVAPNILTVQRRLDADPDDFHLWVCLHEQTHAIQFAAAPWLADHLRSALQRVVASQIRDDDGDAPDPALAAVGEVSEGEQSDGQERTDGLGGLIARMVAAARSDSALPGLLDAMLPPEERAVLERAVAVMSLLEGHADVVMDDVGPRAIPTVAAIRAGFEKRREERTPSAMLVRRLLGMGAKLQQYRAGATFVRGVTERVGHAGLNAVWQGPENLPLPAEILEPSAWVARVHG